MSLASALALRPRLLLLDEPTSQLDPDGAEAFFDLIEQLPCAVLVSEQRPARPLAHCDRVRLHGRRADRARCAARGGAGVARRASPALPAARARRRRAGQRRAASRTASASCSRTRRSRCGEARSSRSSGRTASARRRSRRSPPACWSRRRARPSRQRAAYLAQDPGRHLVTERVLDEVALGADEDRARAALDQARARRRTPSGIRATSPRASASGCRSPRCSRPSPTSSCSTSRRAASIRSARSSWRGCCAPRRRVRGTLVVTHDLPWAAEVADRVVELDVREGVRA